MADEQLYPVMFFGFNLVKGEQVLSQMYVDQWGNSQWKPVPMINVGDKPKTPAIAGYVPEDQE